jgi:hypothetical protein
MEPQEITSVDLEQGFAQLSTGERVPVTKMFTADNQVTRDPDRCAKAVAGSDAIGWFAFSVDHVG